MNDTASPRTFRVADLVELDVEQAARKVIRYAADVRSSDVFFLSNEKSLQISIRRLGTMEKVAIVPTEMGRHMISFVKAMSGMDIAEHRRPLDGRWIDSFDGKQLDLRINTVPTLFGEDMALRLWDREAGLLELHALGMARHDHNRLIGMLTRPSGLILVTGPTGTGKTTTLYACLQHLNDGQRKINTLEDPVEYALTGVRQSQVNSVLGLDFPELLRNVLRQAPHVIMIGEIRDHETAATAVRAANSGHLVLATLHAPVASSAVHSMLVLGSHPYFLSSCLLGIVAQRLVRTLCPHCRVEYDISESPQTFEPIRDMLGPNEGRAIYGPGGCEQCYYSGYTGRTGLFEIMMVNQTIRRLVAHARPSSEIEQSAIEHGMIEFRRSALLKVAHGVTSTEDVLRDVPAEYLGIDE